MNNSAFTAKDYLTTFHIGQDSHGNWMAWKEHLKKVEDKRYCISEAHAKRTRNYLINKFWRFKLN